MASWRWNRPGYIYSRTKRVIIDQSEVLKHTFYHTKSMSGSIDQWQANKYSTRLVNQYKSESESIDQSQDNNYYNKSLKRTISSTDFLLYKFWYLYFSVKWIILCVY